jgi:uncharacterized protein (DUF952 family)
MRIVHIATLADWTAALVGGTYRTSTVGVSFEQEGFIHASTSEQLQATAQRFYRDVDGPLVVLVLSTETLAARGVPVRWEDAGSEVFPHLYAALPVDAVDEVRPASFDTDGGFTY